MALPVASLCFLSPSKQPAHPLTCSKCGYGQGYPMHPSMSAGFMLQEGTRSPMPLSILLVLARFVALLLSLILPEVLALRQA